MELTALETTFYILAIILMSVIVILMIVSVVIIFYIKHKVNMIQKMIEEKIKDVTDNPQKAALDFGTGLLSRIFESKNKK